MKVKKPEQFQDPSLTAHSEYYDAQDFYVGAILELNKQSFLITSADDYVFDFMERPEMQQRFSKSNIQMILNKIAAITGTKFKQIMAR